jgi:hypothetical protein
VVHSFWDVMGSGDDTQAPWKGGCCSPQPGQNLKIPSSNSPPDKIKGCAKRHRCHRTDRIDRGQRGARVRRDRGTDLLYMSNTERMSLWTPGPASTTSCCRPLVPERLVKRRWVDRMCRPRNFHPASFYQSLLILKRICPHLFS